MRRYFPYEQDIILAGQNNIALRLDDVGRGDEALELKREIYASRLALDGKSNEGTLIAALNLIVSFTNALRLSEAKRMLREQLPIATRVLGKDHDVTLSLQRNVVIGLLRDEKSTRQETLQAEKLAKDMLVRLRRVYGAQHPLTRNMEAWLIQVNNKLATYDP